jgi:flagellar biosynthesis protein FlhB
MAEGDQDKTEQPTAFRLDEARRKGEVARSQDITDVLALTGATSPVHWPTASARWCR